MNKQVNEEKKELTVEKLDALTAKKESLLNLMHKADTLGNAKEYKELKSKYDRLLPNIDEIKKIMHRMKNPEEVRYDSHMS